MKGGRVYAHIHSIVAYTLYCKYRRLLRNAIHLQVLNSGLAIGSTSGCRNVIGNFETCVGVWPWV